MPPNVAGPSRLAREGQCAPVDLATFEHGGSIGLIMSRFARTLVLVLIAAILHAGPVAACVCANDMPPDMPCCPDVPRDTGDPDFGLAPAFDAACNPAPGDLLPAGAQEIPAPLAIPSSIPPAWMTPGPPPLAFHAPPAPHDAPPIYLATLRLRI